MISQVRNVFMDSHNRNQIQFRLIQKIKFKTTV
jgi:hypothetical protein